MVLKSRVGARRRPLAVALVTSALLLAALAPVSAQADVTAVKGSAYGYSCVVTVFSMFNCSPPGPTPSVTLASNASNSPQSATAMSANASAGPATIFSSGAINVGTQGTLGATGSVSSSSTIQNVNASGNEAFTATTVAGSCSASASSTTGSTTITNGTLETDNGDSDDTNTIPNHPPVSENVPTNPLPNTTIEGHIHIGNTTDNFRYVFNEQIVNADGSITVNAVHEYLLGPSAVGDLIIGQSVCGVTASDTTPPQTTIDSGPSGTISTNSASFTFSSSEANSTFECKLDGPGAATGTFGSCTSPKNYSSLADGSYTFSVRATDAAGNTDQTPATRSFTVSTAPPPDTTPPQTTIDSGPSGTISTNSASFTFSSSEANSTFECKLDGPGAATGTFGSCTSPQNYSSLADGSYTFSVRATDAAGNTDQTPATRTFTVNTTPAELADLSVDLADSPDPVLARGELTYTVTVTNNGPGTATGVTVFTTKPRGTRFLAASGADCILISGKGVRIRCDVGSVASGASVQLTIVVRAGHKPLTATSTVTSSTSDPVSANNTDTESTAIAPRAQRRRGRSGAHRPSART